MVRGISNTLVAKRWQPGVTVKALTVCVASWCSNFLALRSQECYAGSVSGAWDQVVAAGMEQSSLSDPTLVVPIEKKVLVDGKWLSEGKRSDVQPCSPAYSGGLIVAARDVR